MMSILKISFVGIRPQSWKRSKMGQNGFFRHHTKINFYYYNFFWLIPEVRQRSEIYHNQVDFLNFLLLEGVKCKIRRSGTNSSSWRIRVKGQLSIYLTVQKLNLCFIIMIIINKIGARSVFPICHTHLSHTGA